MIQKTVFISRKLSDESSFHHSFGSNVLIKAFPLLEFQSISIVDFPNTDFIFFYSSNAVRFFFSQINEVEINAQLCCMGSGTAKVLKALGYEPSFIGSGNTIEIARSFLQVCMGKSVLFPRAKNSKKSIQSKIHHQAEVVDLIVYNNTKRKSFDHPNADILVFTSPMNVEAYFDAYDFQEESLIAIGETTHEKMREIGLKNIRIAKESSEEAMVAEVKKVLSIIE